MSNSVQGLTLRGESWGRSLLYEGDATIHGWDAWIGKGVMYKEDPIIKGFS